jgi:transposase
LFRNGNFTVVDGMGSIIRRERSRHTMSALVCGLDVHKDSTYATILDSEGKIVNQTRMENEKVASYLSQFKVARVAMESSTAVAPLYRQLKKEGFDAVVSHPKKTKHIAEAKIKSDRVDSKAIAQLLRMDWLPLSYVPDDVTGSLREKVRRRAFLVRERVKLRVKIKSYLTYQGLKWPADHGLWTKAGLVWLHGLDLAPVESYLRLIDTFSEEIRVLSRELEGLAKNDEDVKLLMTIPGIGYYSALLVTSEIGDIGRFPFAEKLCSYAGLVPSTYQSGGMVRHGNITKEGSRWLRWIMMECASTHVSKYDTWISRSYRCLAGRRGKKTARVAAARKLLVVCFSVLKNKRPFYDQP